MFMILSKPNMKMKPGCLYFCYKNEKRQKGMISDHLKKKPKNVFSIRIAMEFDGFFFPTYCEV